MPPPISPEHIVFALHTEGFGCVLMRSMVRSAVLLKAATDTQEEPHWDSSAAHCRQILGISALIPDVFASFGAPDRLLLRKAPGVGAVVDLGAPLASPSGRGGRAQRGRRGRVHAQTAAKPSQSPSVTALPKGEPRVCCRACLYALFSTTHQSQNCQFRSCFSIKLHQKSKNHLFQSTFNPSYAPKSS